MPTRLPKVDFEDPNNLFQIETSLSKYSLDEANNDTLTIRSDSNKLPTTNIDDNDNNDDDDKLSDLEVSSTLSSSTSNDYEQDSNDGHKQDDTLLKQLQLENFDNLVDFNNGIIHGHIHNYENFTYIHGHIHTNEFSSLSNPISDLQSIECSVDKAIKVDEEATNGVETLKRRGSLHRHSNDDHSLQFSDCQHFEFLNCHDNSNNSKIIEESKLKCEQDENCKPKIVEICCDTNHTISDDVTSFIPNLPNCTEFHQHDSIDDPLTNSILDTPTNLSTEDEKAFEDCNFDDCVDIKCDLDACDIDDLYCKLCQDVDAIDESNTVEPTSSSNINNDATVALNQVLPSQIDPTSYNQAQPITRIKREREDDVPHAHPHSLHHHLHHQHQHQHSDSHHHHHIQLHDHLSSKKQRKQTHSTYETDGDNDELIQFEWNFKNQQTQCQWDDCSSFLDNSFQLQNHIVETHLLSEPLKTETSLSSSYSCDWKQCDYTGDDFFALVNHINSTHSLKFDPKYEEYRIQNNHDDAVSSRSTSRSDLNSTSSSISTLSISSSSTPPTKTIKDTRIPKVEPNHIEQTICKWKHIDSDGVITGECNAKFGTAEELTQHLIQDHVGSGKSEYKCCWENCDRNHRSFNQRQKIIRHLHVHTRYKPFVCSICHHLFAVESMLEQHMRTHSGEKPYKCKICSKTFATSSSLSIHTRIHTGEKPLICKYPNCGKRFSESSNLTKHMKTHEKSFKCNCCSRSFSKEKQLLSHSAKYHAE